MVAVAATLFSAVAVLRSFAVFRGVGFAGGVSFGIDEVEADAALVEQGVGDGACFAAKFVF